MPQHASEEVKQQWKETVLKQRESGLSIASWCQQNNISVHVFYYWRNKLFPMLIERSAFKEISETASPKTTGVFLTYLGVNIHVDRNFDPVTLGKCLQVLRGLSC